jgi:hypothetical protein
MLMLKIIFFKYYFNTFINEKDFKKQSLSLSQVKLLDIVVVIVF